MTFDMSYGEKYRHAGKQQKAKLYKVEGVGILKMAVETAYQAYMNIDQLRELIRI